MSAQRRVYAYFRVTVTVHSMCRSTVCVILNVLGMHICTVNM